VGNGPKPDEEIMQLTPRELTQIRAALDLWAEELTEYEEMFDNLGGVGHFTKHDPMTVKEVRNLYARLATYDTDASEPKPTDMVLACPDCKSMNVQSQYWVRENTREVLDPTERYSWCDDCDCELRFVDLVYIPLSQTKEATQEQA
jgi:hypothetical protein